MKLETPIPFWKGKVYTNAKWGLRVVIAGVWGVLKNLGSLLQIFLFGFGAQTTNAMKTTKISFCTKLFLLRKLFLNNKLFFLKVQKIKPITLFPTLKFSFFFLFPLLCISLNCLVFETKKTPQTLTKKKTNFQNWSLMNLQVCSLRFTQISCSHVVHRLQ